MNPANRETALFVGAATATVTGIMLAVCLGWTGWYIVALAVACVGAWMSLALAIAVGRWL